MKEKIMNWMGKNNMTFSAIAGETFTNGQVVLTHICLIMFLLIVWLVGYFEG